MLKCIVLCLPLAFIQLGCSGEPSQPASPDRAQIEGRVAKAFGEQFGIDPKTIDVNASLGDQKIQADELDVVEIVMRVEEEFDIEIKDEEVDNATDLTKSLSVKTFVDIVASKKKP
jgi:acyl carrier protein